MAAATSEGSRMGPRKGEGGVMWEKSGVWIWPGVRRTVRIWEGWVAGMAGEAGVVVVVVVERRESSAAREWWRAVRAALEDV